MPRLRTIRTSRTSIGIATAGVVAGGESEIVAQMETFAGSPMRCCAAMRETELMRLAGWRSRQMVAGYAASTGTQRAVAAHRRVAPSDHY